MTISSVPAPKIILKLTYYFFIIIISLLLLHLHDIQQTVSCTVRLGSTCLQKHYTQFQRQFPTPLQKNKRCVRYFILQQGWLDFDGGGRWLHWLSVGKADSPSAWSFLCYKSSVFDLFSHAVLSAAFQYHFTLMWYHCYMNAWYFVANTLCYNQIQTVHPISLCICSRSLRASSSGRPELIHGHLLGIHNLSFVFRDLPQSSILQIHLRNWSSRWT